MNNIIRFPSKKQDCSINYIAEKENERFRSIDFKIKTKMHELIQKEVLRQMQKKTMNQLLKIELCKGKAKTNGKKKMQ